MKLSLEISTAKAMFTKLSNSWAAKSVMTSNINLKTIRGVGRHSAKFVEESQNNEMVVAYPIK